MLCDSVPLGPLRPAVWRRTPFASGYDVLPVSFDDGQPFFLCTIGGHDTNKVLLDSSFDLTAIMGSFTQEYPDMVPDLNKREHLHRVIPFADQGAYGRDVDVWVANLPQLSIGPLNFVNYQLLATNLAMEQGDQSVDAVIGTEFLQYFDIMYDFAHSCVLLKRKRQLPPDL
jgi:hypothetical protein